MRDLNDSKANLQALVTYLALLDPNTALPPGAYPPAGRPQLLLDQRIAEGRLSAVRHQGRVFYLKAILPPRAAPVANRR